MKLRQLILCTLLLCPLPSIAQNNDFGTEYELSYSLKPWKGGELSLSEELRLKDNSRRYAKSETGIMLQHALLRHTLRNLDMKWRIGGGYSFINRQSQQYQISNQHRFTLQSSLTKDWRDWRFGFRTRMQTTLRNPNTGSYSDNPQTYLRIRLSARHSIPNSPWAIALSEEGFACIFRPKGARIDECRTMLSATYDIDHRKALTIYAKLSQEFQVKKPETFYALGLSLNL